MNNRIYNLIFFALIIVGAAYAMTRPSPFAIPTTATAPAMPVALVASNAELSMTSRVWHHATSPGPEVLALYGQPGIGGWMPFLHKTHNIMKDADGAWELRPARMAARIRALADDIEAAGFLMLDSEGPLSEYQVVPLYIKGVANARATLAELGLSSTAVGYFRIPDHSKSNAANRFAFTPVIRHTDAVFVMVKSPDDYWAEYLADVVQVAPEHGHIFYLDAYSRQTGQPFSQERIIDTVRLAHGWLRNPQIVFRQSGPHVAQAMKWTAAWLGNGSDGADTGIR